MDIVTAMSMARAGLGVAFLSRVALPDLNTEGVSCRPMTEPALKRNVGLCCRQDRHLPPAAERFRDMLRRHLEIPFVTIEKVDGSSVELHVEHALGSLERPMSDSDIEDKFRGLVDGILVRGQADRVIELCWNLAELQDVSEIARAGTPAA